MFLETKNPHMSFIGAFILAAVFCIGVVGFLNYFVDPANLFDTSHSTEKDIATLLRKGNVGGATNYDERLTQKYRLMIKPVVPPVFLVVGSSRSMQISSHTLHANILNLSVSGATLEDYVAILEMAKRIPAKTVILGVDPWILNVNNGQFGWKSLAFEYSIGVKELNGTEGTTKLIENIDGNNAMRRFLQLFNSEYTKASLQALLGRLKNTKQSKPFLKTDDSPERNSDVIRQDGSRVYNIKRTNMSVDEVKASAVLYGLSKPIYALQSFNAIDSEKLRLLTLLIRSLKKKSDVWLYLPPYHPDAYKNIIKQVPMVKNAEDSLRELAKNEQVKIFGSYNPHKAGCSKDEFFDGMHPKERCLIKIFGKLKESSGH